MGAGISTVASCPFTYGMEVGANMYAEVVAPDIFGWSGTKFNLPGPEPKTLINASTCPDLKSGDPLRRRWNAALEEASNTDAFMDTTLGLPMAAAIPTHDLSKRAEPWGPAFHIPLQELICPLSEDELGNETSECDATGWDDSEMTSDSIFDKRVRRKPKPKDACAGAGKMQYQPPVYDTSGTLQTVCPDCVRYGYADKTNCFDFTFIIITTTIQKTTDYQTEHVLEMQLLTQFFDWAKTQPALRGAIFDNPQTGGSKVEFCKYLQGYWYKLPAANRVSVGGSAPKDPIDLVAEVWPGSDNQYLDEFTFVDKGVNNCKGGMFGLNPIRNDKTLNGYLNGNRQKAFQHAKDCMMALRYLRDPIISNILVLEKNRVRDRLKELDGTVVPGITRTGYRNYQSQGLAQYWETFVSDKMITARSKAETHISNVIDRLKQTFATPAQRQAAQGTSGIQQANARFIAKIDRLEQEWLAQAQWIPPF